MCELQLCLQLSQSLDAAFRGGVYEGAEWIGSWGRAVVESLQKYQCRYPRSLIWNIAHDSLCSIMMNCPCEGLAEEILARPETFVRTTLILASSGRPSGHGQAQPAVFH